MVLLPAVFAMMLVDACGDKLPWEVPVKDITLNYLDMELSVGDTCTIKATVSPSDATNKKINWQTSNAKIATVDMATGLVTAVSEGSATVTAKTDDGSVSESCNVTVVKKIVPVKNVILSPKTLKLMVGESADLSVTIVPEDATDKSVSWSCSNVKVASVSDGKVTAVGAGEAEVTVVTNDGDKTAVCYVYVAEKGVSVESVALDKKDAELEIGDELKLTATVYPENASDKSITWSSSASAVAVVSDAGMVKAVGAGTTVITVKTVSGGKTATCNVTVKDPSSEEPEDPEVPEDPENPEDPEDPENPENPEDPEVPEDPVDPENPEDPEDPVEPEVVAVTSVSLDRTSAELAEGEELTLTATVNPENATDKSVTWTTTDASVASVENGKVTALKAGTATITVTTADGGKTATCDVAVKSKVINVTSVSLDRTSAELAEGEELTLTATVNPENATDKSVTWTTTDASVASVENGKVTALKAGTATITVTTADGGKTATCDVAVKSKVINVTSVSLDRTSAELTEGDELNLTATVNPDNATDKSVTWTTTDASVASVENGKVTALKAGTATITVTTADGGKTATCDVTVKAAYVAVTSVTLDKTAVEIIAGHDLTLTATVNPDNATDKSVTWTTSDASVASVENGKVTGLTTGTATITVTTTDGSMTAVCEVTVTEQPVVTLKQTAAEMTVGEEITLAASVTIDGTELQWSSSDATVASVTDGKVTALKAGTATITVTTADGGSSASCEVTVNAFTGEVTGVTIDKSSSVLKIGDTLTLTAVITPSNATDTNVTWTSSDATVASVAGGIVTALKVGTATIAVTTNDGGKTAYCSVKVITNEGNEGVGENQGNWE